MREFENWIVKTGFFTGELGDLREAWQAYRNALQDSLEEAFPGADIRITVEHGEGTFDTVVGIEGGTLAEMKAAAEQVDRIAEDLYNNISEWAE